MDHHCYVKHKLKVEKKKDEKKRVSNFVKVGERIDDKGGKITEYMRKEEIEMGVYRINHDKGPVLGVNTNELTSEPKGGADAIIYPHKGYEKVVHGKDEDPNIVTFKKVYANDPPKA